MASFGSFGSFGSDKSLRKNKYYDENWYMHLLYSVHKAETIKDIKPADVIVLHRGMYLHFAVVTHTDARTWDIMTIDLHADDLAGEGVIGERVFNLREEEIWILDVPGDESFPSEEVLRRAFSKLGEEEYHLITNNCEHFAMWCKTGGSSSKQVVVAGLASVAAVGGLLLGAASLFKALLTSGRKEDEDAV